MTKKLFFLTLYLVLSTFKINAQVTSTETFETEPNGATFFTDNGQIFNISSQSAGPFAIQGNYPTLGWSGTGADNKFIDNDGYAFLGLNAQFTISSSGATPFKLNSMWLYLGNNAANVNVSGSLTIVGKLGGAVQYTATASSGFNTLTSVANGFSLINLSSFGGQNNANTTIDQIVISTGGNFVYVSLDAFTWTSVPNITATTSQTNVSCNGGSNGTASVTPSGGTAPYTYSWSPSGGTAATATGLAAATYTCTITDAVNNSITKSVTITQPTALTATTSQTNVSCNGGSNGSATVIATGGVGSYTYSWSPSGGTAATATGLVAGTYVCTITDANACTTTKSITITQPTALTATTSQTNVSCNGGSNGSATVIATGGVSSYTYSWSPSGGTAATATGLVAGTYVCTITDANACTTTKSITITQPTALTATTSQTNVSCNGGSNGSATVIATGGVGSYTYSWSPSGGTAATATGLVAGTYVCTITDANSCTTTKSITITQPTSMTVDAGSATITYCENDITPLNANPSGFQGAYAPINWVFANNNADGNLNTANAPNNIVITGGNNGGGNPGNSSYTITFTTNTTVNFNWVYTTDDSVLYDYPQVIVNGVATTMQGYSTSGSFTQSGTMTVNVLAGQSFSFNMYTADNLYGAATVEISNLVIANPDVSYSWVATNGGSINGVTNTASVMPATSGTYTVIATNTAGCTATDTVEVTVNSLTIPSFDVIAPICSGSTAPTLFTTSTNNITGSWMPALVSNTATGTYVFTPDAGQCASVTTIEVTVTPQPVQPTIACYETATFNITSCTWDVTGTQPVQPTIACYETATFNTTTCTWDVTGTQPVQPTIACYETASFNSTTCIWDITGTQPVQPTIACYETTAFNTTTCTWDVTGTQPVQPTIACYETASFNSTTCIWDITGTQPVQPTIACYETAAFNTTTCTWDVTGVAPVTPTGEATQTVFDTNATIENLVVIPNTSVWYANEEDALAGTNPLNGTDSVTNGAIYYAVNIVDNCSSAPFAVTVTVTLANDSFDNTNFNFYPNPTFNVLNVEYSKNIESVSITNLLGQMLFEYKINSKSTQIDLSNLPTATYLVKVRAEGSEKVVKVVKQ